MATIVLDMSGSQIAGESKLEKYNDKIDCLGVSCFVDLPVTPQAAQRVQGNSKHGEILVTKEIDKSTSKLYLACAQGKNCKKAKIHMFRMLEGQLKEFFRFEMDEVYVSRVSIEPEIEHLRQEGRALFWDGVRAAQLESERVYEKVWLNYGTVKWVYTQFVDGVSKGATERGWDVLKSKTI